MHWIKHVLIKSMLFLTKKKQIIIGEILQIKLLILSQICYGNPWSTRKAMQSCQSATTPRTLTLNLWLFCFIKRHLFYLMIPQIVCSNFAPKKILFNHILNFTVSIKCGTTVAENNTYFESGGSESGSCSVKICPCSDNICQVNILLS